MFQIIQHKFAISKQRKQKADSSINWFIIFFASVLGYSNLLLAKITYFWDTLYTFCGGLQNILFPPRELLIKDWKM